MEKNQYWRNLGIAILISVFITYACLSFFIDFQARNRKIPNPEAMIAATYKSPTPTIKVTNPPMPEETLTPILEVPPFIQVDGLEAGWYLVTLGDNAVYSIWSTEGEYVGKFHEGSWPPSINHAQTQLAYAMDGGGHEFIVEDIETGIITYFPFEGYGVFGIEWSPDDRYLLLILNDPTKSIYFELGVIDFETGETWMFDGWDGDFYSIAWSPDGKYILVMSRSVREYYAELILFPAECVLHNEKGCMREVVIPFDTTRYDIYEPEWSPSGNQIAFTCYDLELVSPVEDICLGDINTGEIKNITNDKYGLGYPDWSPDGEAILYRRSGELELLNLKSGNIVELGIEERFMFWIVIE